MKDPKPLRELRRDLCKAESEVIKLSKQLRELIGNCCISCPPEIEGDDENGIKLPD